MSFVKWLLSQEFVCSQTRALSLQTLTRVHNFSHVSSPVDFNGATHMSKGVSDAASMQL